MAVMRAQVHADLQRGLGEALEHANGEMDESFARPDFSEGVQSFVDQRPPSFAGLRAA
jgi:enoyl-CoA hydratase/carnithine racemase